MNSAPTPKVIVIGAGAAGCFGAAKAAESGLPVSIIEAGRSPLRKVRISGGGRCNLTHACFDPAQLVTYYPRGQKELRGAFHRFQPRDTLDWFAQRGVETKTESDGRIFPVSDSSSTIINCLLTELQRHGVDIQYGQKISAIHRLPDDTLEIVLQDAQTIRCTACLLASGSLAADSALTAALSQLGHRIVPPVPSLFTFKLSGDVLEGLAGVSVDPARITLKGSKQHQSGPVLITHSGLSGPAVLKLSAWAARELHARRYQFEIIVEWLPGKPADTARLLETLRRTQARRKIENSGLRGLPKRLWQRLSQLAGASGYTWSQLPAAHRDRLLELIHHHTLQICGKSTHKEEFVTCGGICLADVDFRSMQSRVCPNIYFAGEVLDIDGITGGFNFQAAWTTAHIAGSSIG